MPIQANVLQQSLPAWLEQRLTRMAERAEAEAARDYVPALPLNERYAQMHPDELRAFDLNRAHMGDYLPDVNNMRNYYQQGAEQFPHHVAEYMDPYQREVLDALRNRAQEDYQQAFLPGLANLFIGSGQENSTQYQRMAERGAQLADRNFQEQKAKLLSQGYESAGRLFNADRARALEASSQAGRGAQLTQAGRFLDTAALAEQGQAQRGWQQGRMNAENMEHERQRQHPWTQMHQQGAVMHGLPHPVAASSVTQYPGTPQMNTAGNLAGMGAGLLGAHMQYGRKAGGAIKQPAPLKKIMNIPKLKKLGAPSGPKAPKGPKSVKRGLGSLSFMQSPTARAPKIGMKSGMNKKKTIKGL